MTHAFWQATVVALIVLILFAVAQRAKRIPANFLYLLLLICTSKVHCSTFSGISAWDFQSSPHDKAFNCEWHIQVDQRLGD